MTIPGPNLLAINNDHNESGNTLLEELDGAEKDRDFTSLVDLWADVGKLDQESRSGFALTSILGLSYARSAEICGCSLGADKSIL